MILFRGKRTDNGEWAYGVPTKDNHGEMVMVESTFECEEYNCCGANCLYVDENTVGQYTGLTDKNGTKIFEGDIVKRKYTLWQGETKKTRETQIGVVSYSNKDCGFCLDKVCNLRKPWDGDTLKIIGNIHDSPEKLKIGATAAKF